MKKNVALLTAILFCFELSFAQNVPPQSQGPNSDQALTAKILAMSERQVGAGKLQLGELAFNRQDDSITVEGQVIFAGLADTYLKVVFNRAGTLTYFYTSAAPDGESVSPQSIANDVWTNPNLTSLYLPNAMKKRLKWDSYTVELDPGTQQVTKLNLGMRIAEGWPIFPPLGIKLDKVTVDFTLENPNHADPSKRKFEANLSSVQSWDTNTLITFSSTLTANKDDWALMGELKNLTLGNVIERLKIDELIQLPLPKQVLEQGISLAQITIKPLGQSIEFFGLTTLGNLHVTVDRESKDVQKTDDELLDEYYEWVNSEESYDVIQESTKKVTKWSLMAGYTLPNDFRFANIVPELGVLDQFQLHNAGIVISTADKELSTKLPLFANLGKGNTKVFKGLTFIALQDLEQYKIDKAIGSLTDVTGVKSVIFRGNVPVDMANFSVEAALAFSENVNIAKVLYFRNLKLGAKPLAPLEFSLAADIGFTIEPGKTLEFSGGMKIKPTDLGMSLFARQSNIWEKPFGFPGVAIGPLELQAGVNFSSVAPYPVPDDMIAGGAMSVGDISGQAIIGIDVNKLSGNMVSASFNEIGLHDIVKGFTGPEIYRLIPRHVRDAFNVTLSDAEFTLVPPQGGVSTSLGTFEPGFVAKGAASIHAGIGKAASDWDGEMEIRLEGFGGGLSAGARVYAQMDPIEVKFEGFEVFSLTGANGEGKATWEVNLSTEHLINNKADSRIVFIDGRLKILQAGKGEAFVELTPQGYEAHLQGKVYGFLDAKLDAKIEKFTNPLTNTHVEVTAETGKIVDDIQKFLPREILAHTFTLKSVEFGGKLDNLKSGAKAKVKFTIAGKTHTVSVSVNARDGAKFFENAAKEIVLVATPIIRDIVEAARAVEEAARQAAAQAAKAAQATAQAAEEAARQAEQAALAAAQLSESVVNGARQEAEQAVREAQDVANDATRAAENVANDVAQGAEQAANQAASVAESAAREAEKALRDVGRFFATGASSVAGFAGDALKWVGNFAGNFSKSVESLFDKNEKSRIESDVPWVFIEHFPSGQNVQCVTCDETHTGLRLKAPGTTSSEAWQVLPANDDNYNYLVARFSGLNIHMSGKNDAEGELIMRKHASQDKFKEKIEFVQATPDGRYFYMQFKQRPFYVVVNANGTLDISLDRNRAAKFRVLLPADAAAEAQRVQQAVNAAAAQARAAYSQQRQAEIDQARRAATLATQQVSTAYNSTMQANQARIDQARAAAAQAQLEAQRARAAAEKAKAAANVPATSVAPQNDASAGVGNVAARAQLLLPNGGGQRASSLRRANAGVILENGAFTLNWQNDGNLVVYQDGNKPVWASGTHGKGTDLKWQADGNLVIYTSGRAIWATNTHDGAFAGKGGQRLRLNRRGHLLVDNADGTVIWRSNTSEPDDDEPPPAQAAAPANPGNVATRGQLLVPGSNGQRGATLSLQNDGVILQNGVFILRWQSDGNLVVYQDGSKPVWASNTHGRGTQLSWQPDGNLVVYQSGKAIWAPGTSDNQKGGKGGQTLRLNNQGKLLIQDADNRVLWQSSP